MCNYFLKIKAENPCTCCFHMFIGIVREGGHIYENRSIMLSSIQTCLTGVVLFFSFLRNAACHVFFCCTHENNTQQTEGEEGEGRREKQRNNQRTCLKAKLFIWIFTLKKQPCEEAHFFCECQIRLSHLDYRFILTPNWCAYVCVLVSHCSDYTQSNEYAIVICACLIEWTSSSHQLC